MVVRKVVGGTAVGAAVAGGSAAGATVVKWAEHWSVEQSEGGQSFHIDAGEKRWSAELEKMLGLD